MEHLRGLRRDLGQRRVPDRTPTLTRLRLDPFPLLVFDWQEIFTWNVTVANFSTETHSSRVLHGPLEIVQVERHSQNDAPHLQHLRIGLENSDVDSTVRRDPGHAIPGESMGDLNVGTNSFRLPQEATRIPLHIVMRSGTARVIISLTNDNNVGASQTGVVVINHLRESPTAVAA